MYLPSWRVAQKYPLIQYSTLLGTSPEPTPPSSEKCKVHLSYTEGKRTGWRIGCNYENGREIMFKVKENECKMPCAFLPESPMNNFLPTTPELSGAFLGTHDLLHPTLKHDAWQEKVRAGQGWRWALFCVLCAFAWLILLSSWEHTNRPCVPAPGLSSVPRSTQIIWVCGGHQELHTTWTVFCGHSTRLKAYLICAAEPLSLGPLLASPPFRYGPIYLLSVPWFLHWRIKANPQGHHQPYVVNAQQMSHFTR